MHKLHEPGQPTRGDSRGCGYQTVAVVHDADREHDRPAGRSFCGLSIGQELVQGPAVVKSLFTLETRLERHSQCMFVYGSRRQPREDASEFHCRGREHGLLGTIYRPCVPRRDQRMKSDNEHKYIDPQRPPPPQKKRGMVHCSEKPELIWVASTAGSMAVLRLHQERHPASRTGRGIYVPSSGRSGTLSASLMPYSDALRLSPTCLGEGEKNR